MKRSIGTPVALDKGDKAQADTSSKPRAQVLPWHAPAASVSKPEREPVRDVDASEDKTQEKRPKTRLAFHADGVSVPAPIAAPHVITKTFGAPQTGAAATPAATVPTPARAPGLPESLSEPQAATSKAGTNKTLDDKASATRSDQLPVAAWIAEAIQAARPIPTTEPALSVPPPSASAQLNTAATPQTIVAEAAPPPPAPGLPIWAQAAEDPSLRGTVLPQMAHLLLDAGAAGELSLHLRIKDGVADIRLDGAAAPSLDIRSQDLRAALASEGLTLGSFESGHQAHYQTDVDSRDDAPDAPASPRAGAGASTGTDQSQPARPLGGRVHVTA